MVKRKPATKRKGNSLARRGRARALQGDHDMATIDALFGAFARNLALRLASKSQKSPLAHTKQSSHTEETR